MSGIWDQLYSDLKGTWGGRILLAVAVTLILTFAVWDSFPDESKVKIINLVLYSNEQILDVETSEPGTSEEQGAVKSTFSFYKALEPEELLPANVSASGEESTFRIQVGSFRLFDDADRIKARLALIGVPASIQRVAINDGTNEWFRVHSEVTSTAEELDSIRRNLVDNDIPFVVLRVDN